MSKQRILIRKRYIKIKDRILKNSKQKKSDYKLDFTSKDFWFTESAQRQLGSLLIQIKKIDDHAYRNFFLLCLSACVRYASRADPEIIPPVISKRMRKMLKYKRINVMKRFSKIVGKNASALATLADVRKLKIAAQVGDARKLPIRDKSINLVLTSPPYISAQKYARSLKLELFWTGLTNSDKFSKIDSETIGTERISVNKDFSKIKVTDRNLVNLLKKIKKVNKERYVITLSYFIDMEKSIKEIYRVLKPGGHFVLLIGENTICGVKAPSGKILARYAAILGFKLITAVDDKIKTYGFMTRRNKTAGIITTEHLIIFQKER